MGITGKLLINISVGELNLLAECRKNVFCVSRNFNFSPDVFECACRIKKKRRAFNAHMDFAVEFFLHPDAEGFTQAFVFVGDKFHTQVMLVDEVLVLFWAIGGNANNSCA